MKVLVVKFCVFLLEWVEIKLYRHQAEVGYTCTQKLWLHVLQKFV